MEKQKFDDLSRRIADIASRRAVIRGVAAGILGALGLRAVADAQQRPPVITQAYCGSVLCRNNPDRCRAGCVCCVYSNNNSRCVPPGQCGAGGVIVGATTTTTTTTSTTAEPCIPNGEFAPRDFCIGGLFSGCCSGCCAINFETGARTCEACPP